MAKFSSVALAVVVASSLPIENQGYVVTTPTTKTFRVGQQLYNSNNDKDYFPSPSLAQTHMQGPLNPAAGSGGKALTKEELDEVKKELEEIKQKGGLTEPTRSFMDDDDIEWRFGGPPDYSLANLLYLKGRSKVHPEGSLEQIVENVVKTWEFERSHKRNPKQHQSVDQEKFRISANGGHVFDNIEANKVGNYNVLLNAAPENLYDSKSMTWEDSHDAFETAFAAFPWEVLEVFSGPPKVAFTWRHWGTFTGSYKGNQGKGELVEMFGFGTAVVNDKLQLQEVEIFYNAEDFLTVLQGDKTVDEVNADWQSNHGCPFNSMMAGASSSSSSAGSTAGGKRKAVKQAFSKLVGLVMK